MSARRPWSWLLLGGLTLSWTATAGAAPRLDFERRREVFEFTRQPSVAVAGDKATITFAVKDYCDVTVAIEDARGRIVRHLAAGVLGANAPAPFGRDSLAQSLVWDGKNDQGAYVDDPATHVARVSLGLLPRFERTLFWSPKKRVRSPNYLDANAVLATAPAGGMYIYDGGNCEHIRLFDAAGDYAHTVYPPPADALKQIAGVQWRAFPQDGRKLPLKWGREQNTFLTTGNLAAGGDRWPVGGGNDVRAMAAHGSRVVVAQQRLNWLSSAGGGAGQPLQGPEVFVPCYVPGIHEWRGGVVDVPPADMAFSPDGQWLYLAGYMWSRSWRHGVLNGVGRVTAAGGGRLENFAGDLGDVSGSGRVEKPFVDDLKGNPRAPGALGAAASVAVDREGRVYVADHLNNRIRIFDAAGKPLKDIAVATPSLVRVHPGNGQIFVFSYSLPIVHDKASVAKPVFTRLAGFADPRVLAACALPTRSHARDTPPCNIAVDFSVEPPTIWMSERSLEGYGGGDAGRPERTAVKLLVEQDGKLAVKRDFGADARSEAVYIRGTRHMKQRLYFDPRHRRLYVGELVCPHPEHVTTMADGAVIDPDSGRVEVVKFPVDAEDIAFDMEGHAYLRGFDKIMRYDPTTWREVPFDYGEELASGNTFFPGGRRVTTAITFYSERGVASSQMGGLGVSPKGHIIISACNPEAAPDARGDQSVHRVAVKPYTPTMFPGRSRPWEVHVFDRHGRALYRDAIPGVGRHVGLNMDADDNIYAMLAAIGPVNGQPYFNPLTATLIKLRPAAKILATRAPLPLTDELRPARPPDLVQVDAGDAAWLEEGVLWARGGVGADGKRVGCHCASQSRPAFDYFARTFLPELDRYSVLVVDKNNNEILRLGRYGNVDDGQPLIAAGGPPRPRALGGDEVALMHPQFLATESDRRLFIGDLGNARIVSVLLGYHAEARVAIGKGL